MAVIAKVITKTFESLSEHFEGSRPGLDGTSACRSKAEKSFLRSGFINANFVKSSEESDELREFVF